MKRVPCLRCDGAGWIRRTIKRWMNYGAGPVLREFSAAEICPTCRGKCHIQPATGDAKSASAGERTHENF